MTPYEKIVAVFNTATETHSALIADFVDDNVHELTEPKFVGIGTLSLSTDIYTSAIRRLTAMAALRAFREGISDILDALPEDASIEAAIRQISGHSGLLNAINGARPGVVALGGPYGHKEVAVLAAGHYTNLIRFLTGGTDEWNYKA